MSNIFIAPSVNGLNIQDIVRSQEFSQSLANSNWNLGDVKVEPDGAYTFYNFNSTISMKIKQLTATSVQIVIADVPGNTLMESERAFSNRNAALKYVDKISAQYSSYDALRNDFTA